jgi:hypothetical protein
MKVSASSQFLNETISNWMKKREKKNRMPKLVPELPGHFRTLRSYRPPRLGREREMCGSDGTPTATVTATPAELLRVVAMASLAGPQHFLPYKNSLILFSPQTYLLTYLLAHKVSTVTLRRWRSHGRHPTSTVTAPTSELLRKGFDFCCAVS